MMNVNKEMLSKYLTVSKEKLQSKGVDSVKSRVTNLVDYIPDLTLEALKKALREAFEEVYGLTSNECKMGRPGSERNRNEDETFFLLGLALWTKN